ncbi:MAG: NADH:ubiquinone reductase (Na(+)-transporting) subunit C [Candidatus Cryptobacteroides sp.]|jgi:Na+-transporting NADH:ubiquinone oxidoreductase subunit C
MNTNGNLYTIVYTAIIVVVVAGLLAAAAVFLKPSQQANIKAETISQMLQAAQFETDGLNNAQKLDKYAEEIDHAFTIDANGAKVKDLGVSRDNIELVDGLKAQNYAIAGKSGFVLELPVYVFKNGVSIIPCYGAGLWGPVWGYIAIEADGTTIKGTYFDHDSETAGLGARIKDDPAFRGQFVGKKIAWSSKPQFEIIKGGAPEGQENAIDAISGATITSEGLDKAINTWLQAYEPYFSSIIKAEEE